MTQLESIAHREIGIGKAIQIRRSPVMMQDVRPEPADRPKSQVKGRFPAPKPPGIAAIDHPSIQRPDKVDEESTEW